MRRIFKSERGLTLLEIMIGVVILGIAASMAVPRIGIAMDLMEFRSTNRDVVNTLRMARSSAISEKNGYGVYFNSSDFTATLFEKVGTFDSLYEAGTDRIVRVDTLGGAPGTCIDAIGTNLTNNVVVFESDGSATTGGALYTITLTDNVVGVAVIRILPATGRVSNETWIW